MTPSDTLQQKLAALPEPIQDYLYSEDAGDLNGKIIDRNALSDGQVPTLFALLHELFVKEVPVATLLNEVKKRFGLDEAKAKQLAADIAGFRLLPLDTWIGDVSGLIRSLGADPASYPPLRIKIEHRTADQAAEAIAKDSVGPSDDPRDQARLRGIIESFLAGIRTEPQTLEALTRPEKIGGMAMDDQSARRILRNIREETRSVVIEAAAKETPSSQEGAGGVRPDFATITPDVEAEIALLKEKAAPVIRQADETAGKIAASIEEIYAASGLATEDEAMSKRIKTVIGNRLRDVRDQMETLETMTLPKELGGLGLGQDAARKLLNAMQAKLSGVHEAHLEKANEEKSEWVERERAQKVETEFQEKVTDQTELEKLYAGIVAKSKKATAVEAKKPAAIAAPPPGIKPAPVAPPNLPIAVTNPVPVEARAPEIVRPLPPALKLATPAIATLPPLTMVRPVPGAPMPSLSASPAARPTLQDVRPMPKITGPVEELRAITIVDFRRLSKDPKEACLKIKDKVDLLAEQSFTRRNEAIVAWTGSEVVRTYLDMMRESLNGIPLKDGILAREKAKKPYLTVEEFQAVAALMRQLRY